MAYVEDAEDGRDSTLAVGREAEREAKGAAAGAKALRRRRTGRSRGCWRNLSRIV